MRIGEQLLALAERFDDARARVEGHLLIGVSEGMLAHLQTGIDHLEQGIAAYEVAPRKVERFETGNDPGVVCHVVEGDVAVDEGLPRPGPRRGPTKRCELAERLRQPQSIAYAHFHTGLIHLWLRERERAARHAQAVIDISDDARVPRCGLRSDRACRARRSQRAGSVDDGLARFEAAIDAVPRAEDAARVLALAPAAPRGGARSGRTARRGHRTGRRGARDRGEPPRPQICRRSWCCSRASLLLATANDAAEAEIWFEQAVAERRPTRRADAPRRASLGPRSALLHHGKDRTGCHEVLQRRLRAVHGGLHDGRPRGRAAGARRASRRLGSRTEEAHRRRPRTTGTRPRREHTSAHRAPSEQDSARG